jgi:hypothetical protein
MSESRLELKGLDKLLKALKQKPPSIKVGILGDSAPRDGGGPNNASIGAVHEFGNSTHPQRSFLRIPISKNLKKKMEQSGAFDKATFQKVMAEGSIIPWATKVGFLAVECSIDAFAEGGGKGNRWKPSDMRRKKVHQTLVETQQLRNSITSEVK